MAIDYLNRNGLSYFWSKLKAYFAPKVHTHNAFETKHSYTTAANAAKNWYRIANANTSQLDTAKPIRAQFIVTAYNTSYAADYYETWFVNAVVFGRQAHIIIFGGSAVPFSQARILYENNVADIDTNDRPAIDIYLNYKLANGTTKIEIEEIYNNGGWTFVADGQIAASTVPTGFENVASAPRNTGVNSSTYADYVSYLNRQISNFTAAFTLADSYLYRSRTLNCTGTFTITVPSINSGYMWCVIKNKNTSSGVITLHPSATSVLIDGSNADITLQPMEYVCIHSAGANNYSLIADGRWKSQKADKATTLAGYGITDAKIANGTITLGSNSITPLTSHQTLPTLSRTISGSGNAVTDITVSGHAITATKGATFLTSHQDISGKVNKSGDTMTGTLTQKHTGLVKGSAVSAWTCRDYRVIDNSGDSGDKPCLSWWRTAVGTDQTVSVTINAFKFADESTATASIGIYYPVSGDPYTSAPTPAMADDSTKIATTAFVKAQGYLTTHQSLDGKMTRGSYERIEGTSSNHKDLNDYTTAGFYNVKTVNVDNCPSGVGVDAVLLVYPWNTGTFCTQELTESAGSSNVRRWIRKYNQITWTDWEQLAFQSSLANYVTLDTTQTISATKTISQVNTTVIRTTSNSDELALYGSTGTAVYGSSIKIHGLSDEVTDPAGNTRLGTIEFMSGIESTYARVLATTVTWWFAASILPNGTRAIGHPDYRWSTIYLTSNPNVSSDRRIKSYISKIGDDVLDAWDSVEWKQFKMNESIEEKGKDNARFHTGLIAQEIKEIFEANNLDPSIYGLYCYDIHEERKECRDENGRIICTYRPAGDAYSLRYTEALCMEAAYQRRENARLKKHIADLEERLAVLELKIS